MLVELRDIETIQPYDHNPRENDHAVDAVAASIREFGFRQPIVVDATPAPRRAVHMSVRCILGLSCRIHMTSLPSTSITPSITGLNTEAYILE
jgi:hypothetical protein